MVDILLPGPYHVEKYLDYNIEEFTEMGNRTGCKVYGTLWFALGLVCTDPFADEKGKGPKYDKEKTKEMYYAQALLLHRAGVDGIQFEMTSNEWHSRRYINDLADLKLVEFADKHYMVNIEPNLPIKFNQSDNNNAVVLRIADNIQKATENGYEVDAKILLYCDRTLEQSETIEISMNDNQSVIMGKASRSFLKDKQAVDMENYEHTTGFSKAEDFLFDKEWWRAGEHTIALNPQDIRLGENRISLSYQSSRQIPLSIRWIDVLLKYNKKR